MNTHFSGGRAPSRQRTRFVQGLLFAILAMGVLSTAPSLSAQTEATFAWEAFNDCAGTNTIANTTSITLNGGTTGAPGELLNFATGSGTGVTAQFTATSAPSSSNSLGSQSATGTDARTTFNGRVNMGGLVYHPITTVDWSVDLALSGLDPDKSYTFAITANRNQVDFINQVTRYSLSGDAAATNASTDGVGVVNDHTVYFSTGYNSLTGYVARWTGIEPDDDGTIQITAQNHTGNDNRLAYVCNGFMLAEEVGHVATITTAGTLDAFASPPGVDSAEQSYTVSGSNLTAPILIAPPAHFEVSLSSGSGFVAHPNTLSLTPADGTVDSTPIYVRFNRPTAGTSTGDISHTSEGATSVNMAVTGTAANEAPTDIALSASTVAENEPAGTTVGDFSTTDPDSGDSHAYALVSGDGSDDNAAFTIVGATLQTAETFNFETKDTYSIRVRSTDAGGLFVEESFTIVVGDVNEAPTAGAGPDQTTEVNQPVTLDGSGSTDPDGSDLIYGWTQTSGPEVTLSDVTALAPTFTAPAERGALTFSLTVTDTTSLTSEPDEVTINLLQPEIAISKQADPTAAGPGDTITYTYILTNTGDVALSGVNAEDNRLGILFDEPIHLAVNATARATLTYVVTEDDLPGPLVNTVEVTGTSPMDNVVADSAQAAVILTSQPAISVLKEANVTSATVGQQVTYTYTVINTGDVTLTGVTAIDDLLGAVTLSATTLLPLESASGTLTYTIAESDLPGPLVNTVIATGTPPVGDDVTASDSFSLPVIAAEHPALEASLVASPGVVRPGEIVAYGLTITNTGNVTLAGLESVVSVPGGFDLPDSLLPGQSVTVSYSYTVRTSDLPGPLANEVTVMATSPAEQLVTVTVTATTDVEPYRLFLPLVVKF